MNAMQCWFLRQLFKILLLIDFQKFACNTDLTLLKVQDTEKRLDVNSQGIIITVSRKISLLFTYIFNWPNPISLISLSSLIMTCLSVLCTTKEDISTVTYILTSTSVNYSIITILISCFKMRNFHFTIKCPDFYC